jgi:hypothetical protein
MTAKPLSDWRSNTLEEPSTVVAAVLKNAAIPKALPVRRWHSRQWQSETFAGSPSQRIRNCPQEQLAVLVIMAFSPGKRIRSDGL